MIDALPEDPPQRLLLGDAQDDGEGLQLLDQRLQAVEALDLEEDAFDRCLAAQDYHPGDVPSHPSDHAAELMEDSRTTFGFDDQAKTLYLRLCGC